MVFRTSGVVHVHGETNRSVSPQTADGFDSSQQANYDHQHELNGSQTDTNTQRSSGQPSIEDWGLSPWAGLPLLGRLGDKMQDRKKHREKTNDKKSESARTEFNQNQIQPNRTAGEPRNQMGLSRATGNQILQTQLIPDMTNTGTIENHQLNFLNACEVISILLRSLDQQNRH
ncbi:hypothetical protein CHARACLAT_023735 [Characodon lateralis]|uniref:Uncharacterized protein n=1 Tax=Characodon lateralis TaxID=208331 RepID=A0ABU7F5I4_9TELE|nr:hypothetical protein [Characodon lateralis]